MTAMPEPAIVGRREPTVYGIGVKAPAPERMVTDVIVLTKGISPGMSHPGWSMNASDGLTAIEMVGVLETMKDSILAKLNKTDYR